jgi:hypothetical protein
MTADEGRILTRAVLSLLDVVEELSQGLAHRQTPEPEWSGIVADAFAGHRRELRTGEIESDAAEIDRLHSPTGGPP